MMFAARCKDVLPRLPHFLRIGVAWDRDVAEREAEIAGPHFGKAEPRYGNDLFAIGDTLGAFQLDPQQELAARAERLRITACHVLLGRQAPYPCGSHFRPATAGTEAEPARARFTAGAVHSFDRRGQVRIDPGRMMRIAARFDKRANGAHRFRLAQQDSVNAAAEDLAELPGVKRTLAASVPLPKRHLGQPDRRQVRKLHLMW